MVNGGIYITSDVVDSVLLYGRLTQIFEVCVIRNVICIITVYCVSRENPETEITLQVLKRFADFSA